MDGYLPAWLITIISLVGSTIITTLIGLIIKHYFTKFMNKKEAEQLRREKEHRELESLKEQKHREERRADVLENLNLVLKPIETKIDNIESSLALDKEATIINIRSTMKSMRDKYKVQGYADVGDKATWEELYNSYRAMGGNHFKEYVDQWREEVKDLPSELKIRKPRKQRVKKEILLEKKGN